MSDALSIGASQAPAAPQVVHQARFPTTRTYRCPRKGAGTRLPTQAPSQDPRAPGVPRWARPLRAPCKVTQRKPRAAYPSRKRNTSGPAPALGGRRLGSGVIYAGRPDVRPTRLEHLPGVSKAKVDSSSSAHAQFKPWRGVSPEKTSSARRGFTDAYR